MFLFLVVIFKVGKGWVPWPCSALCDCLPVLFCYGFSFILISLLLFLLSEFRVGLYKRRILVLRIKIMNHRPLVLLSVMVMMRQCDVVSFLLIVRRLFWCLVTISCCHTSIYYFIYVYQRTFWLNEIYLEKFTGLNMVVILEMTLKKFKQSQIYILATWNKNHFGVPVQNINESSRSYDYNYFIYFHKRYHRNKNIVDEQRSGWIPCYIK